MYNLGIMKKEKKNIWITSDPHFGHGNIMKYCSRTKFMTGEDLEKFLAVKEDNGDAFRCFKLSYQSVQNMNDELFDNINEAVDIDDELWILGDFAWANDFKTMEGYRHRIKCKTVKIVWGNHDGRHLMKYSKYPLFQGYYESGIFYDTLDGLISEDEIAYKYGPKNPYKNNHQWYFNHYPNVAWIGHHKGVIMVHGHCHGTIENWKKEHMPNANCFDVGVDVVNYKPVLLSDILSWKKNKPHDIDHHSPKMKIVRDSSGNH